MAQLAVAEKLGKTLAELREQMTPEELWLWVAYINLCSDEERKVMDKAKKGRR